MSLIRVSTGCRGQRDERPKSSQSRSNVSVSVKGELILLSFCTTCMITHPIKRHFSFSDVTFMLLINIIMYTLFEGLIV